MEFLAANRGFNGATPHLDRGWQGVQDVRLVVDEWLEQLGMNGEGDLAGGWKDTGQGAAEPDQCLEGRVRSGCRLVL